MRIEEAAAKKQARIDSAQDIIVGVNKYRLENEDDLQILEVDNAKVRKQQMTRLDQIRNGRDSQKVEKALEAIRIAAKRPWKIIPTAEIY